MDKDAKTLLEYLHNYLDTLPETFVNKRDLIHSEESLLQEILEYHLQKGDFFISIRKIMAEIQTLTGDDKKRIAEITDMLRFAVEKEQKLLVDFLRIEEHLQFYNVVDRSDKKNRGEKDLRLYFYSHIPEHITIRELTDRIRFVNSKLSTNYSMPKYATDDIAFVDLSIEHQNALCRYSQLSIMNRSNNLKTDEEVEQFKNTFAHNEEVIERINLEIDVEVAKLFELEKEASIPGEELIATRKKLKELRTKFDNMVVACQQDKQLLDNYRAHFLKESMWRIISAFDHVINGRLYWFGEPAQKAWVYIVTEHGELIFGNRQSSLKGGFYERLPHATLAIGKRVLASGEAWFKDGKVEMYNGYSGHYFTPDRAEPWARQIQTVFPFFAKKYGLEGNYFFSPDEFPNN